MTDIDIAWSITAQEAPDHPDVERLPAAVPCEGFMSKTSVKAMREGRAPKCKNPARWRFVTSFTDALFSGWTGNYCWSHLVAQGVCGGMEEADRTAEWLTGYRALS